MSAIDLIPIKGATIQKGNDNINNSNNNNNTNHYSGPIGTHILPQTADLNICPECHSDSMIEDAHEGIHVCTNCGLTSSGNIISDAMEWRSFMDDSRSNGSDPNRVGGIEGGLFDMGLSTVIGNKLDGSASSLAYHQNQTVLSSSSRHFLDVFHRTTRLATSLSLSPAMIQRTNEMIKFIMESNEIKIRRIDAFVAACLFLACRLDGQERTLNELVKSGGTGKGSLNKKDIAKYLKKIKKSTVYSTKISNAANTVANANGAAGSSSEPVSVAAGEASTNEYSMIETLVVRYCGTLQIPFAVQKSACAIIKQLLTIASLTGRAPATIACLAVFLASHLSSDPSHRRDFDRLSTVALTSAATLRNAWKAIWEKRLSIIPSELASRQAIVSLPLNDR